MDDMTLVALNDIREFFSDPSHWTQGESQDEDGRYCLLGYCYDKWHSYVGELLDAVAAEQVIDDPDLRPAAYFNDTKTHRDVLWLIDKAIERHTQQTPAC